MKNKQPRHFDSRRDLLIQLALSATAIGLMLYSMHFTVSESLRWGPESYANDPSYPLRARIILIGIITTGISTLHAVHFFLRSAPSLPRVFIAAFWLVTFTLAWRTLPYFVHGISQAQSLHFGWAHYDPLDLPPSTWDRGLWQFTSFLFYPFSAVMLPLLMHRFIKYRQAIPENWGWASVAAVARRCPGNHHLDRVRPNSQ
jgi:hypothetical protein